MLSAFARAFRTPDLRKKLLFTLGLMAIFRLGSFVPTPNVNYTNVQACISQAKSGNDLLGMMNLFSGGALLQLSVFALGIMPYITASIIVQLLRVVIPRFETLYQEGQSGTAKLTQYTRYLTIGLAILQSTTYVAMTRAGGLLQNCSEPLLYRDGLFDIILMIITMTAGTGLIMWLGEVITEKGIGNGMSLLIFTSIAAQFPGSLVEIGKSQGWDILTVVVLIGIVIMAAVVFVEQAQRRVEVQYAKRMVGRRQYGGSHTYIPIKVNMAGVIPVIFASSLLALPMMAVKFSERGDGIELPAWATWINDHFVRGDHPFYIATYALLLFFFTYFYVAITFNPTEVADNIRKAGGFLPGYRAGKATADYLEYVLSRITFPGAIYLTIISLVPIIALILIKANQNFPFGGASLLIIVGVGLETVKQIQAQLQQRHYEGFLR